MTRLHTFVKPCIRSAVEQMQKELISTKGFFSRHLPSLQNILTESSDTMQNISTEKDLQSLHAKAIDRKRS